MSYNKLKRIIGLILYVGVLYSFYPSYLFASRSEAHIAYNFTQTKPIYRTWVGDSWSSISLAEELAGTEGIIYSVKIKNAPPHGPRPNEKVMVALIYDRGANRARLVGQVFDGEKWSNPPVVIHTYDVDISTTMLNFQPFDVVYEMATSSCIVVYADGTSTDTTNALWASWDGSSWITGRTFPVATNTNGQRVLWVRAEAQPRANSNLIFAVFAGADSRLYAVRWTGSTWTDSTNITNGTIMGNALENIASYRSFDIAFTSASGTAYIFGAMNDAIQQAVWNGTAWVAGSHTVDIDPNNSSWAWCEARPDPTGTDRIAVVAYTLAADLAFAFWSGSGWTTWATNYPLETNMTIGPYRPQADFRWEANGTRGILSYTESNQTVPRYRVFTPPSTMGGENSANNIGGNWISMIRLFPEPGTNNLFLVAYNDLGNLVSQRWNSNNSVFEPISILTTYVSFRDRLCYDMSGDMIVYGANYETPGYRKWTVGEPGQWDPINSWANDIGGSARHIRFKASPKLNEKMLITQDNMGDINSQIWNGTTWSSPQELTDAIDVVGGQDFRRGFDAAYESNSGDALIVYSDNTTIPKYRTRAKGQTTWSNALPVSNWPGSGTPVWIRVEPNPNPDSDEMIVLVADTNFDLFAIVWNGSSFITGSIITLTDTLTPNTGNPADLATQNFDVAYTYDSPNNKALVMFAYGPTGDGTTSEVLRYNIWFSTSQSWATTALNGLTDTINLTLNNNANDNSSRWIKLASDRSSSRIGWVALDNNGSGNECWLWLLAWWYILQHWQ